MDARSRNIERLGYFVLREPKRFASLAKSLGDDHRVI
jgi:hypothetical protein